jgi:CHAT domain-containing protein/tetratricopeptide (TPR) repeat protein
MEHNERLATAAQLSNRGIILRRQGHYDEAERAYMRALELLEGTVPEDNPQLLVLRSNLAVLHLEVGRFAEAQGFLERAIESVRGKEDKMEQLGLLLNNLGGVYRETNRPRKAAELFREAVAITAHVAGKLSEDYAQALNNLGLATSDAGDQTAALPCYEEALAIRKRILEASDPRIAQTLNNLALAHQRSGDYATAVPIFKRALEICGDSLGRWHPSYADSANNLGLLYHQMGSLTEAEPLFRHAVKSLCKSFGYLHPKTTVALANLGMLYLDSARYRKADLYLRAAATRRRAADPTGSDYGTSLNHLGLAYIRMKRYEEAKSFLQDAIHVHQAAAEPRDLEISFPLNNLAVAAIDTGKPLEAQSLLREVLQLRRAIFGEKHPEVEVVLSNLAMACAAAGQLTEARSLLEQAAAVDDAIMGQFFTVASEAERMAHLAMLAERLHLYLSLIMTTADAEAVGAGCDLVLRRKGLGLEALVTQRNAVVRGRYPDLRSDLDELLAVTREIARLRLTGPGHEQLERHQRTLLALEARKASIESDLARKIPEMDVNLRLRNTDQRAIASALPPGSVLLEFILFNFANFAAVPADGEPRWLPPRYAVFAIAADAPNEPHLVDLGDAVEIDQLVEAFRANVTEPQRTGRFAKPAFDRGQPMKRREYGLRLRSRIIEPLLATLGGRTRMIISPDGGLTRLPFEVLPFDDSKLLIDRFAISYVAVGREILSFNTAIKLSATAPVVIADPDFDLVGRPSRHRERPIAVSRSHKLRATRLRFARLPGTRTEGEQVASILGVRPLLGSKVLKASLRTMRSPAVLHLATHGFFLANQEPRPNEGGEVGGIGLEIAGRLKLLSALENPMLRSGLALAGANTWLDEGVLPDNAEDAILSAEDVAGLDLLATELVVLSACETGLGDVQNGEGVFGFRRAFALAGSATLIMSLWKVPDQETQELIVDFYRRLLRGEPRAEALRQAQLAMRKKHPDPFYWGAFICQGAPGPLRRPPSATPSNLSETTGENSR